MAEPVKEEGRGPSRVMPAEKMKCARCGADLEEGFLLDGMGMASRSSSWVAGRPEAAHWLGVRLKGRKIRKVSAFRCTRCGLLESYAL